MGGLFGLTSLAPELILAWLGGALGFVGTHSIATHVGKDGLEVRSLRRLVACQRVLIGSCLLLLIPLALVAARDLRLVLAPMTSYGNGLSWNFGWGRPCGHFVMAVGMFLEYHPALRWACIVGLAQAVVLDTLSAYDLHGNIACVLDGRCSLPDGFSWDGLRLAKARDLAAMLLEVWALLLMAYLNLVIGPWRTTYSYRQLSGGEHNRVEVMRAQLQCHQLDQVLPLHRVGGGSTGRKTSLSESRRSSSGRQISSDKEDPQSSGAPTNTITKLLSGNLKLTAAEQVKDT